MGCGATEVKRFGRPAAAVLVPLNRNVLVGTRMLGMGNNDVVQEVHWPCKYGVEGWKSATCGGMKKGAR